MFGGRDKLLSLWGLLIAAILSVLNLIIARPNAQNTPGQYTGSSPQKRSATIPWAIPIALVGLWLISLFKFGGGLFHVLLLAAIILFIINLSTGGRMAR
jgi:hypothetical protein